MAPDKKKPFFLTVWTIVLLAIPLRIYGANSRLDISSILFDVWYDFSVGRLSIQYIPRIDYILPSLLICTPCFLWLYRQQYMSMPILLGSAGLVMVAQTLILLLFLPSYAVFPWYPDPLEYLCVIRIVPNFIDLIPFSSIAFTTMVLLPLLWRVSIYTKIQKRTLGREIAGAVLSVLILLFPMTIETASWWSTDFNQNFFEEFSVNSATWSFNHRVDGNLWGQNVWYNFTMSSNYTGFIMILQIVSAVIFAWFVCRRPVERKEIIQMLVAGLAHLLIVTLACVWLNYAVSHLGSWTILPFPILFIVGIMTFSINYGNQLRESKHSIITHRASVEDLLTQLMATDN